ncbi:MAG: 3-dehydroquinate synthase [Pseudomonadota bacterium]
MNSEEIIHRQSLTLRLDYPVIFTHGILLPDNPTLCRTVQRLEPEKRHTVAAVLDGNLAQCHPDLQESIRRYAQTHSPHFDLREPIRIVQGGEACKNAEDEVGRMHRWMLDIKLDRHSTLLVFGGGAVLDMAGHAAATFHRGLRLIRLPTTVLAQNDAGVGVKNGINRFGVKNLIGSFAAPFAVISDFDFLSTLEVRDRRAGLAEAVKVALIRDGDFFRWMQNECAALAGFGRPQTEIMIRRCAELHLDHIANGGDPFESGSSRPLDFGHWAAHKLESMTCHSLRHGEAVAIGMALDSWYACAVGLLSHEYAAQIDRLLQSLGFALWHPILDTPEGKADLLAGLDEFREHLGGEFTLTMPTGIGSSTEIHHIDRTTLLGALNTLQKRSTS